MKIREYRNYTITVTTTFEVPDGTPHEDAAQIICTKTEGVFRLNQHVHDLQAVLLEGPDSRTVCVVEDDGSETAIYEWS